MKVPKQHAGSLQVIETIYAVVQGIQGGHLCGGGGSLLCSRIGILVGTTPGLGLEGRTAVLCMDRPIVSEQQVSTYKGAFAFVALEGPLLGVCSRWH
jgi:hypothetical protein